MYTILALSIALVVIVLYLGLKIALFICLLLLRVVLFVFRAISYTLSLIGLQAYAPIFFILLLVFCGWWCRL